MNNELNWQDNTEASKRLYIIRVLQRCGLSPNDLLLVYFSMVHSILEYACPVWHTMLPKCLGNKIEKVQKRAFCIIYPTTEYEDALNIAKCKRLDDRRQELQSWQKLLWTAPADLKLHASCYNFIKKIPPLPSSP